ncbi:MAG: DUF4294 domain-containing protein [Bacteroidia bacterium]|nr:DUF4294 domain-containing protein [Bacteroidia bacterium]MBT8279121.1 DUF4294 domain-containing protein [Bacteroidia bacterium]NND26243.1 DUF4294 domain-containing protein [Flavobacteriaceae bacterium]NNK61063.1 DUF4294 domain-containing protein [Flavobacteriaceae bacterium]NNL33296.1 DUF4294 domain-containing protein [Flavobacteriaceae bacterium]
MKKLIYILIVLPTLMFSQVEDREQDSLIGQYIIIEGDSIPRTSIDLDEVLLLHKLEFNSKEDRRQYLILKRKTIKVYPYAKLAAERLESLTERLASIEKKSDKKKYAKRIQKYIEGEFKDELKKLTRTEGQILVKLIHRQTGKTTFDLIKQLRNGWRAFWFNNTANVFDISLKREFDPLNTKEDYLIEDILQRNFQNGRLKTQKSALDYDFFELSNKWLGTDKKTASSADSN